MGFRNDNQQGDLCVDSWARCLRASSRVLRVAPHLDNDGNTLKSSVPHAVAARGGGHYAPHELKVYVDASNRFLTTGVSTHGGRLHVYMREPPQALVTVAESVFKAAVAELSRWQRLRSRVRKTLSLACMGREMVLGRRARGLEAISLPGREGMVVE